MSPTPLETPPALIGHSVPLSASKARATAEAWGKKRHSYKPLRKQFRHDGFDYRLIARERRGAIYEQRSSACQEPSVSYEVVSIRKREGFEIHGRFVAPAEVYPRREQWGELGWTFCDKQAAFAKLREIG